MLIEPDGRLRITDFGLALALRGGGAGAAGRYGGATSRSGTPQFAAPEQLIGEKVDQRADLYSLGAVASFALRGRPPFEGITAEAILAKQATDSPPTLTGIPGVSREFEAMLRRAMSSDPARRFPTAQAFHEGLRDVTGGSLRRLWALLRDV